MCFPQHLQHLLRAVLTTNRQDTHPMLKALLALLLLRADASSYTAHWCAVAPRPPRACLSTPTPILPSTRTSTLRAALCGRTHISAHFVLPGGHNTHCHYTRSNTRPPPPAAAPSPEREQTKHTRARSTQRLSPRASSVERASKRTVFIKLKSKRNSDMPSRRAIEPY